MNGENGVTQETVQSVVVSLNANGCRVSVVARYKDLAARRYTRAEWNDAEAAAKKAQEALDLAAAAANRARRRLRELEDAANEVASCWYGMTPAERKAVNGHRRAMLVRCGYIEASKADGVAE